jgi:hypothetical protein
MNRTIYTAIINATEDKLEKRFRAFEVANETYDNVAKQFIQFYGAWDYEGCFHQIIVTYHPNGKQCAVNIISETIEVKL